MIRRKLIVSIFKHNALEYDPMKSRNIRNWFDTFNWKNRKSSLAAELEGRRGRERAEKKKKSLLLHSLLLMMTGKIR